MAMLETATGVCAHINWHPFEDEILTVSCHVSFERLARLLARLYQRLFDLSVALRNVQLMTLCVLTR
jgi:hypothetical protein